MLVVGPTKAIIVPMLDVALSWADPAGRWQPLPLSQP